jgi:hypothetical protein
VPSVGRPRSRMRDWPPRGAALQAVGSRMREMGTLLDGIAISFLASHPTWVFIHATRGHWSPQTPAHASVNVA